MLRAALGCVTVAAISACGGGGDAPADADVSTRTAVAAEVATAPTWTHLSWENQSFTVSGTRTVRYGANGSWVTKTVSGTNPCSNTFFGRDPLPGVGKTCQLSSETTTATTTPTTTATTWTHVAWENQAFSVSGTKTVRYGANNAWVTKSVSGSAQCSNAFFGKDPAYGIGKTCQVASGETVAAPAPAPTPAPAPAPVATGTGTRSGIGINLELPTYWQSDWPYINELKRAAGWSTRCESWATPATCTGFANGASANDTLEQDKVSWDENGYAKRLPAANDPTVKYRQLSALLFQGDGGSHPAGRYVVLYEGDGTIEYSGAGRKIDAESRAGRDVVEVTSNAGEGMLVRITRINEANHLRNIRVIGPGGICSAAPKTWVTDASRCPSGTYRSLEELSATQTFHPAYVGDLSGFRTLRFMKWSEANTGKLVSWANRPTPNRAIWSSKDGVPYEAMFELARATGADPWVNVPPYVDDDFARQLGRLAKAQLAPGATLYFEYGNEPWNQAPPYSEAGVMFEAKAKAKWPGATMPMWQQRLNWYAYRSVQLCRLVKAEFGADASRVKCMANSQAANTEVSRTMMACDLAKGELGNNCGRLLDGLAIAPYFGYYLSDGQFATQMDAWANEPDGGMDKIFRELTGRDAAGNYVTPPLYVAGGWTPRDGSLAEVKRWITSSKAVADQYGIPLIGYEAGQHLHTYRGGKVEEMFRKANRDPRMGAATKQLNDDWRAAGGQLLVPFSYTQRAERGGAWGMKEHQRDDAAPKWQAVKASRALACNWAGC